MRSQNGTVFTDKETAYPALEETKSALEKEEEKSSEDNVSFGTDSDDSDIDNLKPPKLEEIENQEAIILKKAQSPEDFNMGSFSSTQYTFCRPETMFSSQASNDESNSNETSHQPSPAFDDAMLGRGVFLTHNVRSSYSLNKKPNPLGSCVNASSISKCQWSQ